MIWSLINDHVLSYFLRLLAWRASSWVQRRRWWSGFWMLRPEETYPSWPCCCHMPRHSSTRQVTAAGRRWCSLLAMDTTMLQRHCCLMGRISDIFPSTRERLQLHSKCKILNCHPLVIIELTPAFETALLDETLSTQPAAICHLSDKPVLALKWVFIRLISLDLSYINWYTYCFFPLKAAISCQWTVPRRPPTTSPSSGATNTSLTSWPGQMMATMKFYQGVIASSRNFISAEKRWTDRVGRGQTRSG